MKVVAVLGNVTPHRGLVSTMRWFLDKALPAEAHPELVDLSGKQLKFGSRKPGFRDDSAEVLAQLRDADALIFATPAYQGGLGDSLTTLLHRLPLEAVASKPVGIIAVGGTPDDFYAADWHLRSVLVWTDAFIVPASVHVRAPNSLPKTLLESERKELKQLANWVAELANAVPRENNIPQRT
jgi:NAD(P)H-dependent FMN reductase